MVAGPAAAHVGDLASPDLAPGQAWSAAFPDVGMQAFHCKERPDVVGWVEVEEGAPTRADLDLLVVGFSPPLVRVAPGGVVTWTNRANGTHAVVVEAPSGAAHAEPPGASPQVVAFLYASGALSLLLVGFAARAYHRNRDANMAFVASAFTLFTMKDALVAYSLQTGVIPHQTLESVDAAGDLATVLLLVLPLFWSVRR